MVYLVYSSRTSNRSDFTWKSYHNEFLYVSPPKHSQKLAAIWWEVKGNYVNRSTCARLDSASLSSLKRIKAFRQVSSILSTLSTNNWTMNLLRDVTCSLLIFITSSKTIRSWLRPLAMASSLGSGRFPERRTSIFVVSVKISNNILVWSLVCPHWKAAFDKCAPSPPFSKDMIISEQIWILLSLSQYIWGPVELKQQQLSWTRSILNRLEKGAGIKYNWEC